jgi:CubicO group peptidase (beta-lactamase class C family)
MIKALLKKLFVSSAMLPLIASADSKQSYLPPTFTDSDRLTKIEAAFPEIDAIYKTYAEKNHIPGYAFGIVVDGKLVYAGSGGYADLSKKIPATPKTYFRIASMTKSFTAMAILQLRDAGKLKLDDPVSLYIPELQNQQLTQDADAFIGSATR